MGDKYDYLDLDSLFSSDFKWSKRSLKFLEQLKKEEEERAKYKAVFTDLEDLEASINKASSHPWPELGIRRAAFSRATSRTVTRDVLNNPHIVYPARGVGRSSLYAQQTEQAALNLATLLGARDRYIEVVEREQGLRRLRNQYASLDNFYGWDFEDYPGF